MVSDPATMVRHRTLMQWHGTNVDRPKGVDGALRGRTMVGHHSNPNELVGRVDNVAGCILVEPIPKEIIYESCTIQMQCNIESIHCVFIPSRELSIELSQCQDAKMYIQKNHQNQWKAENAGFDR